MEGFAMTLSDEIRSMLIEKGASIVGYGDLSEIPEQYRKGYKYGISIAVTFPPEKVRAITDIPNTEYYNEYQRINQILDSLGEYTADLLRSKGFDAYPNTRGNVNIDQNFKRSELPHKTVATRAGIGWIGKCALLVTEEYGTAIRFTSVLTNVELEVASPINESKCGNCNECKETCPANAVSGKEWDVSLDRDEFFRAIDCSKTIHKRGIAFNYGRTHVTCGLCILTCPWTQRYLERKQRKEDILCSFQKP
jgi:epoxyqueuosine reductase